jgi:hypothetical protein
MTSNAREFVEKQKDGSAQSSALQIIGVVTQARPSTAALAMFATKTLVISASLATVGGLAGLALFAPMYGPVMPFLVGSWIGFTSSLIQRYRYDGDEAIATAEKYPELMQLHIDQLMVNARRGQPFDAWAADLRRSHYKRGLAIVAMYGASEAVDRVRARREEGLIEKYYSAAAAADAAGAARAGGEEPGDR